MRKAIGLGAGVALLAAAPAAAMVPPSLQRQGELRAVIDLPGLAATLGAPIDRIEHVAPDLWRVTAGRCHVDVRMVPAPGARPGLTGPRAAPRPGRRICER